MYTIVGVIINSHGIKGGVKVYPYTFDNNRFYEYVDLFIGDEKIPVHIKDVSFYKNLVILTFKEFDDINQILKFKDSDLYIKTKDRKALEDGNYYIGDILACKVYDESGNYLGEIREIIQGAANDVYVIKNKQITGNVPAVKEFIKEVDIVNKKIIIKPIEGLFNEDWYINLISWFY